MNRTKNIFNLGCMVGLRFSDLMNLKKIDVEVRDENTYLNIVSIKTGVHSIIKLPIQAIDILNKIKINGKYLLPRVSLFCFNRNLKKLGELAGWTHVVGKCRQRRGKDINCKTSKNSEYRFCDHLSSHAMRRTAITLLLTMGVPELLVRKFSGHSTNSKSFNRYVNLAQSYMDKETDSAFEKLFQI